MEERDDLLRWKVRKMLIMAFERLSPEARTAFKSLSTQEMQGLARDTVRMLDRRSRSKAKASRST